MEIGVNEVRTVAADPETKTPASHLQTGDEQLERFMRWYQEDAEHCTPWHNQKKSDDDFVAGRQWSEEDLAYLAEQNRPALTFNRAEVVIDAVTGAEVANRQEVRYKPRTMEDDGAVEITTEAARFMRDGCDAEHEESLAFADAVVAGIGATSTLIDYEENPDGETKIEAVDMLELYWDSSARRPNLLDAKRVWRVRRNVPIEEARDMFPDFEDEDLDATWASDARAGAVGEGSYDDEDDVPPDSEEHKTRTTVTLVEVQWIERKDYYRGFARDLRSGMEQETNFDPEQHENMRKRAHQMGWQYKAIKQKKKCYYKAFIGRVVLTPREEQKCVAPSGKECEGFSYNFITAKRDRNKGLWYGLVRQMRDPQLYANKWLSTALHRMMTGSKGGVMAEKGAIKSERDFNEGWARGDALTLFENGALTQGRVQPKPVQNVAQFEMMMMESAVEAIPATTGVNFELLGLKNTDQAASLEFQRRQSGTVILAGIFDSLRRYRKVQGRLLLHHITEYLSDGRLIRITGQDKEQYLPLLRREGVREYDIIVDDAPSSPNQKEATWAILQQLLPVLGSDGMSKQELYTFLEASPLPPSIVAKLRKQAEEEQPQPSPEQIKVQGQMQIAQQKAEQDAQKTAMQMQLGQQKAQMEAASREDEMQMKREEHKLDMAKAMMDLQKTLIEMNANMQAQRQEIAMMRESNAIKLQGQREQGEIKLQTAEIAADQKARAGEQSIEQARQMGDMKASQADQMGKLKAQQAKAAAKKPAKSKGQ